LLELEGVLFGSILSTQWIAVVAVSYEIR